MPINVLMEGLPSRTMAQEPFDESTEKFMAELPEFGRQATALEANVNAKEASAVSAAQTATLKAVQASESASAAELQKQAAAAKAQAAADSAAAARNSEIAAQGVQLTGTSATSLSLGTGVRVFDTQPGKQWPKNVPIIAVDADNAGRFLAGTIVDYAGSKLTMNVTSIGGPVGDTVNSWNISTASARGAPGATASNTQFDVIPVAAETLDLTLGNVHSKTVNGNITFVFSAPPIDAKTGVASRGFSFTLEVIHVAGIVSLPASVKASRGLVPAMESGKTHLLMFVTTNGGATWRISVLPNYES